MVTKTDSSLIVHDGETIKDALDTTKPIANYTALRAYTGSATQVRITSNGLSGFFYRDNSDTTSVDNGGTVIVSSNGKRWKRVYDGPVNCCWFGADPLSSLDSSPAITASLSAAAHVVVPPGTYRCNAMIELGSGKTLQLLGGAALRRYANTSTSEDPVVWLKGSGSTLIGAGQGSCTVISENRIPKGAVRVGHKDMTESHASVTYCTVKDMTISGFITYGQTTGEPDVALYLPNPQFNGLASYFHNIFGIRVQRANYGIHLQGWANGNTISNIQGYQLGNTTLGVNKNAFIFCQGALDNAISNVFFHASPNSIGLLIDNYDNTAIGGSVHNLYANSFSGMVFEQGGASALGLKAVVSGDASFYEIRHNVAGGNIVPSDFSDRNVFIGLSAISCGNMLPTSINARTDINAVGNIKGGSVESTGDLKIYGALRTGNTTAIYIARKVKTNSTANAATVTFTLSNTSQASLYRYGYVYIKIAGGDNASASSPVAWYLYRASTLATPYPSVSVLKDSGGDTASFTVTDAGNGNLTVTSIQDFIICEVEYAFPTGNVNIT